MFTGLVETLATVVAVAEEEAGKTRRFSVATPADPTIAAAIRLGESVALNGCCLTAIEPTRADAVDFQAGTETLMRTNLATLKPGSRINLERALAVGARLGGHFVQGHVDGVGSIARREPDGEWMKIWFYAGPLVGYMVSKGSVAVDGISLTLVDVTADQFSVALIPHTLAVTTLGFKEVGEKVNLEVDILAKYVQRAVSHWRPGVE